MDQAERTYKRYLEADLQDHERVLPDSVLPSEWALIDTWMYDKLLAAVPSNVRDTARAKVRVDYQEPSHFIMFHVMKYFAPGGADERERLESEIRNPQVCTNARQHRPRFLGGKRKSSV